MAACDLFVTKAGPGTIAEAMVQGLPMVLSSFLPGQVWDVVYYYNGVSIKSPINNFHVTLLGLITYSLIL